jgi:hypothetical protein
MMMEIIFFFILTPIITMLWLLLAILCVDLYKGVRK